MNRCVSRKTAYAVSLFCFSLLAVFPGFLTAQEAPTTGTIQGTVQDVDGNPVSGARLVFRSREAVSSSVTRSGKDGSYVSDQLLPGKYTVLAEGRNFKVAQSQATVQVGAAATANFQLEPINPAPARPESMVPGETVNTLPINGRNYLDAARLEPGVQIVDGAILDPGKSGYQTLSLSSTLGRTTHYDLDEVEAMDETRGAAIQNLPSEAVREVIVARSTPDVFQSLNANGAVRVTTLSGGEEWHGNLFGNYRDGRAGVSGFPGGSSNYSRQQYGFGAGGSIIKDKAFIFLGGERTKQDGFLPVYPGFPMNFETLRDAALRENMLTGRLDYNLSENAKWFYRYSYDNAGQFGPDNSLAPYDNEVNVPSHVFGLDWNHGRFAHSGRFGYDKLVDAINPSLGRGELTIIGAPFHQQIGSFEIGPSNAGPRQTIQRDLFGRYDASTIYRERHTIRFGGAIHHISQGDFYSPGLFGASVTSSNGLDVIQAINSNPNALPGGADNPLNYPVGTVTIYNGLGNFSEHSAFNRSTGGYTDTRIEAYVADTFKLYPNLNITVGMNYIHDTGRTNSDLGAIPCSAINTTLVVTPPCTGSSLILDQYGNLPGLGDSVAQPRWNFSPQAGVAWDPGRNGKTVVRAGGGMFFDNFLLQNAYQDRISRLTNGQYFRSLTLCPTGSVLFPDGSRVSSVDGLDIASQVCGQPIGNVSTAIQDLQSQFLAAQAAMPSGAPNVYSLAGSVANFGGMLAPNFRTPRVVHMNLGIEHQLGERSVLSIDYVRQIGTQYPLGIDTNHVGDVTHLDSMAGLAAINATLLANPISAANCTPANAPGSESQAAVNCYMSYVPSASIVDFARQGLDSSNAYCGPFPCAVLGLRPAAFSGINPTVGSNLMFFPTGRSKYQAVQVGFKTGGALPFRSVRRLDLVASYTFSKYETNVAMADGSGGDYSLLSVAEDYNNPHVGHFGNSGLDRRNQFTFAPSFELLHGLRFEMIAQMLSPLSISARLPQQNGGGVAGEIFRTDATGDGTVGDLLPGTKIGGSGGYSGSSLANAVAYYNTYYAGQLTPAAAALAIVNGQTAPLMTGQQLRTLGAVYPFLQPLPANTAQATWLKTVDLRLSWPLHVGERVSVAPTVSAFNVLNLANFGGPGRMLNGILDGAPGSSLNNSSSPGVCGQAIGLCTSRLDRVVTGSGTYNMGAPRQVEFGVRITF